MDLLKPVKDLIGKGKEKVEIYKEKIDDYFDIQAMAQETAKLNEEFSISRKEKEKFDRKFNKEEDMYLGDREFGNIRSDNTKDDARTVVKIEEMLIEAQIDLNIPEPVFKAVNEEDEEAVKELQAQADYTIRSSDLPTINSSAEREVKKHGTTCYKIIWNNCYKGAGYRGRPEILSIHPKNIIPFAGTSDIEKAEGLFSVENETLAHCIRTYGDIAKKLPQYGQTYTDYDQVGNDNGSNINKTNDTVQSPDNNSRPTNHPLNKYTIIEKWYRDEDGDICLKTFSGSLILLDKPKFYYRRKFNAETEQFEIDEDGNEVLVYDEELEMDYTKQQTDEEGNVIDVPHIKQGERVPYYIPKTLPIVFQYNIPRSKCPWGISDIEITKDISQAIKKAIHKHEERILSSNTKVIYNKQTDEEAAQFLDNDDFNIIGVNDVNSFKTIDFKSFDNSAIEFYNLLIDIAQRQLGITQVWQGVNNGEASSGKMAEALINQTAEKISIKSNEKNIAYKKIYKLVCDFLLAFSDDERPHRIDSDIKPVYGKFNRLNMVKKDKNGEWVYPDWDIEISAEQGFPRNKTFMFDSVVQLSNGGFLQPTPQNIMIWTLLDKMGYPNATSILQNLQEQTQQLQEQQMQEQQQSGPDIEGVLSQLPPDIQEQFAKLTPEEQAMAIQGG